MTFPALAPQPCRRRFRAGWVCTRGHHTAGPCALLPAWWNLPARWRFRPR